MTSDWSPGFAWEVSEYLKWLTAQPTPPTDDQVWAKREELRAARQRIERGEA